MSGLIHILSHLFMLACCTSCLVLMAIVKLFIQSKPSGHKLVGEQKYSLILFKAIHEVQILKATCIQASFRLNILKSI